MNVVILQITQISRELMDLKCTHSFQNVSSKTNKQTDVITLACEHVYATQALTNSEI